MSISGLFIRRPVMTTLVMLAILLFGVMSFLRLPVSDLPNVDYPTIQVSATLPGASPETMAASVATPLEKQFSTIAGLDSMSSTSTLGSTQISLQFSLSRNIDAAAQDAQAAIAAAGRQLPPDLPSPPTYQKVNPAGQPVLYIALTSPTLALSQLDEYGETLMAQRISTVNGVAQVQVYGSQKYAVRIKLDPYAMATRGIGINEVADAVQNANVNLPTGVLYGRQQAFTVQATGQLNDAAGYRPLVVAYRNSAPVRLSDLGEVYDSVENDKTAAWYTEGGKQERSIILAIQRQPGTNTVEVVRSIRDLLPTFRHELPASVELHILYDRSEAIQSSVHDIETTLLLAFLLVVMVIFLFLRSLRATAVPSLALPMSVIGTFAIMYLLDYSVDNLSLMALTLSVGFVVDDAIVMLENIVRHTEMGKSRMQAAFDGAKEVGFTIVSMTLSLAAVFIPVLFMGGLVGRLFREFAVTIGVAVLISGVISLTLTPMLASRVLRPPGQVRHGRLYRASERGFGAMLGAYGRGLNWSLDHRRTVLIISLLVLAGTVVLFIRVPKGFLPGEDRSQIIAFTEGAQGISYISMVEHQQAANRIIEQDPNVQSFMSSAGSRGGLTTGNTGIIFVRLKPPNQRSLSADQVIAELRPKLSHIPGLRVYLQNPPPINIGGRLTRSQYQLTLQSPDTTQLYRSAQQLESRMRGLPGLVDVNSDLEIQNPQVNVDINRDKAASLNVTPQQIEDALDSAYSERQISTILAPNNEYQVIMQLEDRFQKDPAAVQMLYIRSTPGQLVPMESLASLVRTVGPLAVNHTGQLPSVTISFNLSPNVALGQAVNEVNQLARQTLPAGITTSFQGTAQAFESSLSGLGLLLVMAIVVIYLVLGILYESFIHPLTILTALPFAGFGALLTLMIFHTELSMYAFVGLVMLVGLVKKNGIMMIDFAIAGQRDQGKTPREAIFQACQIRFRPIMMTTLSALMAGLPIAIGFGAGAEARRPLGLTVVGGLLFSQTLTLFVTPVFYLYMEGARARLSAWLHFGRREPVGGDNVRAKATQA